MGAFIDLFVGVGEVTFMFILVTPDGVVSLGMFGEGFYFFLGEAFHLFSDVHTKRIAHRWVSVELWKRQIEIWA